MTPYIIEERQLNVAQMDVFSRLMMDRIIFLGTAINDQVGQHHPGTAALPGKRRRQEDIQIYLNSPVAACMPGLGIYDTMQYIGPDVATICTGMAPAWVRAALRRSRRASAAGSSMRRVMIHQPMGGAKARPATSRSPPGRSSSSRRSSMRSSPAQQPAFRDAWRRTGDRDYWMIADEAKAYGMIDELLVKN
jgi:ATP-dependent Clp protease protease subunit